MILFVCLENRQAPFFGRIKLNKILWKSDFDAFRARGVPVTGRGYQRLKFGPAPKEMHPLLQEMRALGEISEERTDFGDGIIEYRPIAHSQPNLWYFSNEDVGFVRDAIAYYWHKTGRETSDDSHGPAWKTRLDHDPMPYESAFLSAQPISSEQHERLSRIVDRLGLSTR